ncbi:MAG TPA: hypothetical protein VF345_03880 [Chthoniobacterales bacterium]
MVPVPHAPRFAVRHLTKVHISARFSVGDTVTMPAVIRAQVSETTHLRVRTIILDQSDNGPAVCRLFARAQHARRTHPEWDKVS